ncbi:MAG: PilZ domain-containing protein [Deltaproteobacteria bacterium]|nr:PilZ domain-containing protein [Deltaproteobacteria bacterium]
MLRRRKQPPPEREEPLELAIDPGVLEVLGRLEATGVQLSVRPKGAAEGYTSSVVGRGRDGFFIDTLSPPEGDARLRVGGVVEIETLFQGYIYRFETAVLGKVRFVDDLPAFKLSYPEWLRGERRRRTPRVETRGDASLSFLRPFPCDAPVVNLSEGGLAFEYGAELGRLRKGTLLRDVLLELGVKPVVNVQGRVVAVNVAELGGIGLPRRFRISLAFQGLVPSRALEVIQEYLAEKGTEGVLA